MTILGRPNVGKSALFNRLIGKRKALVDATPGLTRDRLYGEVTWRGLPFQVVDTGGLQFLKGNRLTEAMRAQVAKAMEEATLALLVCDGRTGPVPLDEQAASWARRWGKSILVVVNKVDSEREEPGIHEFSRLGLGNPLPISALHGRGIGELLDEMVARLKKVSTPLTPSTSPSPPEGEKVGMRGKGEALQVAVVGRPNVGKSSLMNRILNEERVLVDEAPGTTRDPVETHLTYQGQAYCFIDTAGIRARPKIKTYVEAVARLKAAEVIRRSHVCLAVVEGPAGIVQEDLKVFDEVVRAGRPVCVVVNKWDLVRGQLDPKAVALRIAQRAPFLRFAPVVLTSAKTGFHVLEALECVGQIARRAGVKVPAAETRRILKGIQTDPRAPVGIRNAQLFRMTHVAADPCVFQLWARVRRPLRDSEVAYLEGVLRRELKLVGIPIRVRCLTFGRRGVRPRGV